MRWSVSLGLRALACLVPSVGLAQSADIAFPRESPRGTASVDVAFTRIVVDYGRPAVRGRPIWGGLVPWDSVWRAGANENTVLEVSSPVTIGGTSLPAGRYGLHMIPTPAAWTVIVSREANNWGSFSYRQDEDVLRYRTTAAAAPMTERLEYTFDDVSDSAVVLTLRWEKLAVPLPIAVNTRQVVEDSIRSQLRGVPQFFGRGWAQAAAWALRNNRMEQAAAWSQEAVARQPTYETLHVRSLVLQRQGDSAGAAAAQARALAVATEANVNALGYELLGQEKVDEAIRIFEKNVRDYPKSWNTYDSLGEAWAVKGDRKRARQYYEKALAMVGDPAQQQRIRTTLASLQ